MEYVKAAVILSVQFLEACTVYRERSIAAEATLEPKCSFEKQIICLLTTSLKIERINRKCYRTSIIKHTFESSVMFGCLLVYSIMSDSIFCLYVLHCFSRPCRLAKQGFLHFVEVATPWHFFCFKQFSVYDILYAKIMYNMCKTHSPHSFMRSLKHSQCRVFCLDWRPTLLSDALRVCF